MEEKKVYTDKMMNAATFFGGPLVGGYMLSENFKLFDEDDKSRRILFATIIFFFLFFEIILLIPDEVINKIPNIVFPAIYVGIGYWIYKSSQKEQVDDFLKSGGSKQSGWKITGITIIGMILTLAYILFRASSVPPFQGELIEFGTMKNQLYFEENVNQEDVKLVGEALTRFGYFHNEFQQAAKIENINNKYYLYMFVDQNFWEDENLILGLQLFEETTNLLGLDYPLKIYMYDENLSGAAKKILPKR